jgi:hypothetical protein
MDLIVKTVAKDPKQAQGETYWPVLGADGNSYNLIVNYRPQQGQAFNVDVKESVFKNKTYRWANIVHSIAQEHAKASVPDRPAQPQKAGLNQYMMAEAFDYWWEKVNATGLSDDAKASMMCTLLIATADGRVKFEEPELSEEEDNIPF